VARNGNYDACCRIGIRILKIGKRRPDLTAQAAL